MQPFSYNEEQIITETLKRCNNENIVIHDTERISETAIKARISYEWTLNGHRKEVHNNNAFFFFDSRSWIRI